MFGAIASALGAAAINAWGAREAGEEVADATRQANADNRAMSREQMRFQEKMSSTAHFREVQDLKNAGLNPILSANGGASTPSGSMAVSNAVPSVKQAVVSSARDAVRFAQEVKESQARIENLKKDSSLKHMLNTEAGARIGQIAEETGRISAARRVGEAEAWQAENVQKLARDNPRLFGILDAISSRLNIGGSARSLLFRK